MFIWFILLFIHVCCTSAQACFCSFRFILLCCFVILLCENNQTNKNHFIYFSLQGVIRDEKDLDMLGPEFKAAYAKTQFDPFDEESVNNNSK